MATFKPIPYAEMTPSQQERARAWAKTWGMKPEECPMHPRLKMIITQKEPIIERIGAEDYGILSRGLRNGYVDSYDEITEEIRQLYRAEMAQLKADNLPKVKLK